MAKYTELFGEYLEGGGELPASFDEIEGFADKFKQYYCDKEIGFETEELFAIKLNIMAEIVIPEYKRRIDLLTLKWTGANNPTKIYYENVVTSNNFGNRKSRRYDLPFESAPNVTPAEASEEDARQDDGESTTSKSDTGATSDEYIRMLEFLNRGVKLIILDLLKEFKNCFMGVY